MAFKKIVNAAMPDITKTPGNDEGVQFDFKKLFIKVAEKEVCQTKSINANNTSKYYRLLITQIITVKINTLRLNFVVMVLNTAGCLFSFSIIRDGVVNLSSSSK